MADSDSDREFTCSLDRSALRLREGEFRDLFARSLRKVEKPDAHSARMLFDADCEAELRALLARETRCCSFSQFTVDAKASSKHVELTVRVPTGSEAALAFLLGLTAGLAPPHEAGATAAASR